MPKTTQDPNTDPAPDPTPDPQQRQQDPQADPEQPPWGDDFDASKAWKLTQNLRSDKEKLQAKLAEREAEREELEKLRSEKLTADERALKEAKEQAAEEARKAANAEWGPKYLTSELKSIAAQVIKDEDELTSFMAIVDPGKFKTEDGEIDREKVMGHLTALYVGRSRQQQPRQWGQHSGQGRPPEKPGAAARSALEKRHGVKQPS